MMKGKEGKEIDKRPQGLATAKEEDEDDGRRKSGNRDSQKAVCMG
jgi:hypothetical protein